MADTANLDILLDLARQQLDDAALGLRNAADKLRLAQEQRQQLDSYRHDYQQRAQQSLGAGVSASNYRNFVQFLETLDNAISLQNKTVSQLEDAMAHARSTWQQKKRQLDAYDALKTRRAHARLQEEKRKEQRQTDERASRRTVLQTSSTAFS